MTPLVAGGIVWLSAYFRSKGSPGGLSTYGALLSVLTPVATTLSADGQLVKATWSAPSGITPEWLRQWAYHSEWKALH